MNLFLNFFTEYIQICDNKYILICFNIISIIVVFTVVCNLISTYFKTNKSIISQYSFWFFIIPAFGILFDNISWIVQFFIPQTTIARIIICIAWIFSSIKFHSFTLFLEQLTLKSFRWQKHHIFLFILELILCVSFIINTIQLIYYNKPFVFVIDFYYASILFWFISTVTLLRQLLQDKLPIILKKQLNILLFYFLCPHFICILLEFLPIIAWGQSQILIFSNLSIILITASFYFCFKKIMQFRFLNLSDHVQTQPDVYAVTDFKEAIEQINIASNEQELTYITQQFFITQLNTSKNQINLYIRSNNQSQDSTQKIIESFLNNDHDEVHIKSIEMLFKHKILVCHEIEFDEFYTDNLIVLNFANFLRSIQCDIFLPIINNKKLLGYITVQSQAHNVMYNLDQQNKMMVFAQFLAPAIYMLQQQNTYSLLHETKEIKEELYAKHQEINQYKESIKQLLKDRLENHIGIIIYKNRHFSFKNQEAQTLLEINLNLDSNHPTCVTILNFVQQVEKYQTTQNMYLTLHDGLKLIISGIPQAQPTGGVLLIIRKPEATDLIKMHIDALKNPSQRDYLLYLETTKAGQIINKLLPSNHEAFLNIKIQLLQTTLQKSSLLLEMHSDDINAIVEIMHQLSGKDALHIIDLQQNHSIPAEKIFGINPLLEHKQEPAILEKLSNGTLLIKNIELLDTITQQKLAYLIRYGIYTPVKSEQRKFSDTRIICSTSYKITDLLQEGRIISELCTELQKNSLIMPSLITMKPQEVSDLIDGFMYQNIQTAGNKQVQALNVKEKEALIAKHIPSLFALQQKVQMLMNMKTQAVTTVQTKSIHQKTLGSASPELQLAAQLGKHALKDIQLMKTLWQRLGNQTKIADLLGVNRSSVNRRCKEYNLI